eukprot:GHVQ01003778.1.p1 GENE.GHVQ01003778.1~~GHVQ01003778.1.p1  ORF type:complete len:257 (+),score=27.42 GHVQ01003778.1:25-771(+)
MAALDQQQQRKAKAYLQEYDRFRTSSPLVSYDEMWGSILDGYRGHLDSGASPHMLTALSASAQETKDGWSALMIQVAENTMNVVREKYSSVLGSAVAESEWMFLMDLPNLLLCTKQFIQKRGNVNIPKDKLTAILDLYNPHTLEELAELNDIDQEAREELTNYLATFDEILKPYVSKISKDTFRHLWRIDMPLFADVTFSQQRSAQLDDFMKSESILQQRPDLPCSYLKQVLGVAVLDWPNEMPLINS